MQSEYKRILLTFSHPWLTKKLRFVSLNRFTDSNQCLRTYRFSIFLTIFIEGPRKNILVEVCDPSQAVALVIGFTLIVKLLSVKIKVPFSFLAVLPQP